MARCLTKRRSVRPRCLVWRVVFEWRGGLLKICPEVARLLMIARVSQAPRLCKSCPN